MRAIVLLALAACSAADSVTAPGIHDSWGTRQNVRLATGAETIENYLVLRSDGTMRRYFRVKEAETAQGKFETTSAACAKGRYSLTDDVLVSDLVISQSSKFADTVVQASHEQARAALVGPQLRVERTDQGIPAPVLIYDRLVLPDDIEKDCAE